MTPKLWFAIGTLASASFVVSAQPAPTSPNPLDASADVPALSYRSAFDTFQRTSGEEQPSADKVWRKANEEVARSGAHGDHAVAETAPSPAATKAPPTDHSKHH